jgi:hypothetical protein
VLTFDGAADVQPLGREEVLNSSKQTVGTNVVGCAQPDKVIQQVAAGGIEADVMLRLAEVGVECNSDETAVAGVLRRQVSERTPTAHSLLS